MDRRSNRVCIFDQIGVRLAAQLSKGTPYGNLTQTSFL